MDEDSPVDLLVQQTPAGAKIRQLGRKKESQQQYFPSAVHQACCSHWLQMLSKTCPLFQPDPCEIRRLTVWAFYIGDLKESKLMHCPLSSRQFFMAAIHISWEKTEHTVCKQLGKEMSQITPKCLWAEWCRECSLWCPARDLQRALGGPGLSQWVWAPGALEDPSAPYTEQSCCTAKGTGRETALGFVLKTVNTLKFFLLGWDLESCHRPAVTLWDLPSEMKSALRFCCTSQWRHSLLSREFHVHSQQKDPCSGHLLRTPHKTCLSHTRATSPALAEQHFTALWNVLFHVSPESANVSACLGAEPCHPHCCCLQLLWAVTSPPANHPLHHRRGRRDWEDVFKCQEGMAAPEGLQPMGTLPRLAPAAMAGSYMSSQCQITLVFIPFPSLCTTACSSHSDLCL